MKNQTSGFTIDEVVTTDFYPKDKSLHRVITNIEQGRSQTGFFVTTVDKNGRKLRCDSDWYERLHK